MYPNDKKILHFKRVIIELTFPEALEEGKQTSII
jgi:hypothetical protein